MSVATFSKLFPLSAPPVDYDSDSIISDIEFGNMIGSAIHNMNRQLADAEGDDTSYSRTSFSSEKIIESEFTNRKSADAFIETHEQLGYHCSEYESYNYPRQYIVVRMKYDS